MRDRARRGSRGRCDVSVPLSRIAIFIEAASRRVVELGPEVRMVIYGHMGDGNVHFNPLRPKNQTTAKFLAAHGKLIAEVVDELAAENKGSISAEHGVGVAKRDALLTYKSPVEIELMWQIQARAGSQKPAQSVKSPAAGCEQRRSDESTPPGARKTSALLRVSGTIPIWQ